MSEPPLSRLHARLYTAGATLFVLTGIAHTIGQFAPSRPGFAERAVISMMRSTHAGDSGMSYWNILMDWGAMYGLMSFALGVALFAARRAGGGAAVLRALAAVAAFAAAGQAAVSLLYRTPPPAFFMIPAAVVLGLVGFGRPSRSGA